MLKGELIDATHLGIKGNSNMLYSWIDWSDAITNKDAVEDFRKINQIRLANEDIFHFNMYDTKLINVPCESTPTSPVKPYVRFIPGEKARIVIGNNSTTNNVTFSLHIPFEEMGMNNIKEFYVTDCWTSTTKKMKRNLLNNYSILVPRDKSKGGGVRVIIISKKSPED